MALDERKRRRMKKQKLVVAGIDDNAHLEANQKRVILLSMKGRGIMELTHK